MIYSKMKKEMKAQFKVSRPVKIEFGGYQPKNLHDRWIWNFVLQEFPKLKAKPHKDNFIEFNLGKKRFKIIRLK